MLRKRVNEFAELVDMEDLLVTILVNCLVGSSREYLSHGLIVSDPEILILDEPTVGIDTKRVAAFLICWIG